VRCGDHLDVELERPGSRVVDALGHGHMVADGVVVPPPGGIGVGAAQVGDQAG
jgi:hypothetical protein